MQRAIAVESAEEIAPKLPLSTAVGTMLVMVFAVAEIGIMVWVCSMATFQMPASLIIVMMAEAVLKILLSVMTRSGKLWTYQALLALIGIGIILNQIMTGKPQVIAFLLFVLLVANHKGYTAFAEYQTARRAREPISLNA